MQTALTTNNHFREAFPGCLRVSGASGCSSPVDCRGCIGKPGENLEVGVTRVISPVLEVRRFISFTSGVPDKGNSGEFPVQGGVGTGGTGVNILPARG